MEPINPKFETRVTGEQMPSFNLKEAELLEDGSLFDEKNNIKLTPEDENSDGIIDSQIMEILDKNMQYFYIDNDNDGTIDAYEEYKYKDGELTESYREYESGRQEYRTYESTDNGKLTEYYELQNEIQTHLTELEFESGEKYYDINGDGLPDATEYAEAMQLAKEAAGMPKEAAPTPPSATEPTPTPSPSELPEISPDPTPTPSCEPNPNVSPEPSANVSESPVAKPQATSELTTEPTAEPTNCPDIGTDDSTQMEDPDAEDGDAVLEEKPNPTQAPDTSSNGANCPTPEVVPANDMDTNGQTPVVNNQQATAEAPAQQAAAEAPAQQAAAEAPAQQAAAEAPAQQAAAEAPAEAEAQLAAADVLTQLATAESTPEALDSETIFSQRLKELLNKK